MTAPAAFDPNPDFTPDILTQRMAHIDHLATISLQREAWHNPGWPQRDPYLNSGLDSRISFPYCSRQMEVQMNPDTMATYHRLTVAEARALPLRALQEHVFWVGFKRTWDGVRRSAEPGFPWFPMHMDRSTLIDAVGDWASVFDPTGGHAPPPANIVQARPSLMKLGTVSLVIHVAGASAQELDRGAAAAAKVLSDAGTDPISALKAWGSREMSFDGEPDADVQATERDWELAEAWDEASQAALEACCAYGTRPPLDYTRLEILDDDDAGIRQLMSDLDGIPLDPLAAASKTAVTA